MSDAVFMVIKGSSPFNFSCFGPFDDYESAEACAEKHRSDEGAPVWVIEPKRDEAAIPTTKQKFEVCLQQYVEQLAEMIVYAGTAEEARDIALKDSSNLDWRDGPDAHDVECYAVNDPDGVTVWER